MRKKENPSRQNLKNIFRQFYGFFSLFIVFFSLLGCKQNGFVSAGPVAVGAVETFIPSPTVAPTVLTPILIPTVVPPVILVPPAIPTAIEFGTNEVYHLGDGAFSDSNCKSELSRMTVAGLKYIFAFEVLDDNVHIDISINKICGLSELATKAPYNGVNLLSPANAPLATMFLTYSQHEGKRLYFPSQVLNRGIYKLEIQAGLSGVDGTDIDDFIVGKIQIRSDKAIAPRGVSVQ